MECQHKRSGAPVRAPVAAKKAKLSDDPAALQKVTPILSTLEGSKMPAVCKEMFRSALPHCLGMDRHGFKTKMLDLAAVALMREEEVGRTILEGAEARAENLRAKVAVVSTDFEAAQRLATTKQEECDAASAEVDGLRAEREAARIQLASEEQEKEALIKSKTELVADQEFFQKVLPDMQQPLQEESLAELIGKLTRVDIEGALVDALPAALKVSADERTSFTQRALDIAVQRFNEHMVLLGDRLAGIPNAQEQREAAVAEAQAKLVEIQERFLVQDKAYDELQNSWAELETNSKKQQSNASAFDTEIQAALDEVEARKADLDGTRAVVASFEALRKGIPAWTSCLPVSEKVAPDIMQVEAEIVAVAA